MANQDGSVLYLVSSPAIRSALVNAVHKVDALANSVSLNNTDAHVCCLRRMYVAGGMCVYELGWAGLVCMWCVGCVSCACRRIVRERRGCVCVSGLFVRVNCRIKKPQNRDN